MPVVAKRIPLAVIDDCRPRDRRGRPLRDLRISVVDRCNFRCPYCMPESRYPRDDGADTAADRLTAAEIVRIARAFVALGVDKLRLTGGEPLLRRDLPDIVARLAAIEGVRDLALTTNGSLLAAHAAGLRAAGLRRLTVSLDAIDAVLFARMSGGRGDVAAVLDGIAAGEAAGFRPIKVNAVLQRGVNDSEVEALVARFRGSGHVLRFIEYMDVGTCNRWQPTAVVPSAEIVARVNSRWPIRPLQRSYRGEVAERWAFEDGAGEIGFVSSVSAPFCGDCHRARLSSEGRLYSCLFAASGADLRPVLRGDDASLREAIASVWRARVDRHSELRAGITADPPPARVEMYRIGG
ncbi:MAG: GTP 3',8-cyclase MoaA [Pseudomonadota bacterium]|jgi:cyclic pyranopterin phosphate synthase